ncbi:MAG: TPM domain-containing protein [Oscillospiraceae bacterium]|nr:TPM domain-containing protein [Oscillospiraceae bacterium]
MKKTIRLFALLVVLCLLLGGLSVCAEDAWSEDYYRVIDMTDALSDEERDSLDEDCIALMRAWSVDLALLVATEEDLDGDTPEELADYFYEDCGFGYGSGRDGFMAVYLSDTKTMEIYCYGNASRRLSAGDLRLIEESAPDYEEEYGLWGVLYSVCSYLDSLLEDAQQNGQTTAVPGTGEGEETSSPAKQGGGVARGAAGKPDWYPVDTQNFPFYHDETAPRVVDDADLFSASAEARMEERLSELRRELGKDIVIFTDVSAYGLSHAVYAADFYDFNGYGIGPDYEGICLFICMDPADRGFWTCCTGPVTRDLYTEGAANALDDVLYEYMASAAYTEGVEDWIENVRTLYVKGYPFVPEWYPEPGETVERFHDTSSPRVVDDAGLLTPDQVSALTAQAAAIAEKYGMDVAVHVSDERSGITRQEYSDMYYAVKGLGYGDSFNGILLSVFQMPGYYGTCRVTAQGAIQEKLTEVNLDRLTEKCTGTLEGDKPYQAIRTWLKDVEHLAKTGRVPQSKGYWIGAAVIGLLGGSIVGGIALGIARKKMAAPAEKKTAEAYMVPDTLSVRKLEDRYTHTTTSRKYSPVQSKSSGGGGGGSSYSRSYSGSSGRSHSGSGRRF